MAYLRTHAAGGLDSSEWGYGRSIGGEPWQPAYQPSAQVYSAGSDPSGWGYGRHVSGSYPQSYHSPQVAPVPYAAELGYGRSVGGEPWQHTYQPSAAMYSSGPDPSGWGYGRQVSGWPWQYGEHPSPHQVAPQQFASTDSSRLGMQRW